MPVEILNTIENGSLPSHQLDLKIGSPIMVIRNIDSVAGICNNTRLFIKLLRTNIIEDTVTTDPNKGDVALIPRTKFISSATEGLYPVDFQRVQFPIRLAFGMTINKEEGQKLSFIGLYLPCHVFAHSQLCVALSCVRNPGSLKLMIPFKISGIENQLGKFTEKFSNNPIK